MFKAIFDKTIPTLLFALACFGVFSISPSEARADGYFNCTPNSVIEYSNRVHVHCTNSWAAGGDTITFIAIDKTDVDKLRRFVALGSAAVLGKKFFRVYLLTSDATNVAGCQSSDCRTPTVFGLKE